MGRSSREPRKKGQRRWKRSESETARKKNALVRLRHPNEKCSCAICDTRRMLNGNTRVQLGWAADYPPKFYDKNPPERGWEDEWESESSDVPLAPCPVKADDPMF